MPFSLKRVMTRHRGRVFEKWIFDAHSPLLSSAAIGDIDGDGNMEVIFGTKEGLLVCLDHEAKEKWTHKHSDESISAGDEYFYDLESLHAISSTPVLADINNDGKREIIFGTDEGYVVVVDCNGKQLWKKKIGGAIRASPKVADFNNDGKPEILVTSTAKKLVVLDPNGEILISFKTVSEVQSTPGVWRGKQGKASIVIFGMDDGTIHAIDAQENQLWTYTTQGKITAEPVFLELGKEPLVLIGSWDGTLYALTLEGELKWQFHTEGSIYNKIQIEDINNDGNLEIVFGSCDNKIYALSHRGELLWNYETDFWVVASPIVTDIDDDGSQEVLAGSYDNNVYVLEGAGSYELDYVPGLSGIINQAGHYAHVLSSEPGDRKGKRIWQYKTQGIIVGTALLDEPGHPQLVVNVKSGFVDALGHKD